MNVVQSPHACMWPLMRVTLPADRRHSEDSPSAQQQPAAVQVQLGGHGQATCPQAWMPCIP